MFQRRSCGLVFLLFLIGILSSLLSLSSSETITGVPGGDSGFDFSNPFQEELRSGRQLLSSKKAEEEENKEVSEVNEEEEGEYYEDLEDLDLEKELDKRLKRSIRYNAEARRRRREVAQEKYMLSDMYTIDEKTRSIVPLESLPDNSKDWKACWELEEEVKEIVHIAFVLDSGGSLVDLFRAIKGWLLVRTWPMVFHIIMSAEKHKYVKNVITSWKIAPETYKLQFYAWEDCYLLLRRVGIFDFIVDDYPLGSVCKVVLHKLIPPEVTRILVQDTDVWPTQHDVFYACWAGVWEQMSIYPQDKHFIGMVEDTSPKYYTLQEGRAWPTLLDTQYNAGILWLDLGKMRKNRWFDSLMISAKNTFRQLGYRARKGEQCLLNNLLVYEPDILHKVDCGCNYQAALPGKERLETTCPASRNSVYLVHNWGGNSPLERAEWFYWEFIKQMDSFSAWVTTFNIYNNPKCHGLANLKRKQEHRESVKLVSEKLKEWIKVEEREKRERMRLEKEEEEERARQLEREKKEQKRLQKEKKKKKGWF